MRKSGEKVGVAAASGEIVVGRSLSVAKRVFLVLECALELFILWSMLLNRQNVGWYPVKLPFFYWLAVFMGVYWIAHGGWLFYTGLSPIPQIETSLDGVRLFCLVRFSTPWENIKAIEPASTAYIGPGRNVLPGNILPYGPTPVSGRPSPGPGGMCPWNWPIPAR
ncbi:hypothetical protein DND132_0831 [Pseudodesulfovibrio mercurii]|uniref:Uncharacterized protein n=1 Tax=Pseudodesulfovibrio mercurii TaxID=641491 RepID=F0JHI6_9BACT|nr:hypothetical protein [Pseudodesulfovibrio mercurii]EGB14046.1 hypothetical protein DND132_0831 [Pseudodesulfovibrio mercurii]